jgi:hypothetical protein
MSLAQSHSAAASEHASFAPTFGEPLAALVPGLMDKYDLSPRMSPEEVLAALRGIAQYSDKRSRWLAAFASPLGRVIAGRGVDLNTALASIVGQLPQNKD